MSFLAEWLHILQNYNRNVKLFFIFNLLWNTGIGMFSVIYNLYIKSLGYQQEIVGNVVAMTALGSALILIPAGFLTDRYGPKLISQIGLAFAVIALCFRPLLADTAGLTIAAFISGMFISMLQVTGIPFLTENSTLEQRMHLFSLNMALNMFGNFVGNIGGGALTDGLQTLLGFAEISSLRITLMIGVAIAALGIIPVCKFQGRGMKVSKTEERVPLTTLFMSNKPSLKLIGWFTLLSLMTSSAGGLIVPYLNVYFSDRFEASKTAIGFIVAMGQGATAVAYLIGPALARRVGEVRAVVILQLSSIPFLILTAFTMNFYLASIGYLFRQALMNAANPFQTSIKMARVNASMRGLANSMGDAAFNLGWFLVAPINTYLVHSFGAYWGYAYAFSITAIIYCMVAYLFAILFKEKREQQLYHS